MHLISTHTTRLGRSVAALLATAAALAIGGCQAGPVSNDTMGGGSNNAGGSGGTTVATSASTTPGRELGRPQHGSRAWPTPAAA